MITTKGDAMGENYEPSQSCAAIRCIQCRRARVRDNTLCDRCDADWIRYLPVRGPRKARIYRDDDGTWHGVVTDLDGIDQRSVETFDAMHAAWAWCRAHDGSDPSIREVTARRIDPAPPYIGNATVLNGIIPAPPPPPRAIQQPLTVDGGPLKMERCKGCKKLMHKCDCAAELEKIDAMRKALPGETSSLT